MATAWATRRGNKQTFRREVVRLRRDDLRDLVDEAARLLGPGATNLRLISEADEKGERPAESLLAWQSSVFPLQQRLRLRLPATSPVLRRYADVRQALIEAAAAQDEAQRETRLEEFEDTRDRFLDEARAALEAPIKE